MEIIHYLDLLGTVGFAVAGAFQGIRKKVDIIGVYIAGILTAVGGGTMRDVFIFDQTPFWIEQTEYLYVASVAIFLTFFIPYHFARNYHFYRFMDSIGLAVFMILGMTKALHAELPCIVMLISGILPAIGGGILRAISLGDLPPYVLRSGFYAAPALIGGGCFLLLLYLKVPEFHNICVSMCVVLLLRLYGGEKKWKLPTINFKVS